ncbi:MAG: hypothetical protein FJ026_15055, partial [Chloroflexi bacterium]|nr:hypothetical protein [Chloroflexota bacterium]
MRSLTTSKPSPPSHRRSRAVCSSSSSRWASLWLAPNAAFKPATSQGCALACPEAGVNKGGDAMNKRMFPRRRYGLALSVVIIIVLLLLVALLLASSAQSMLVQATPSPTPGTTAAWPMFGHDPQHTGRSPYVGPQTPTLKWRYQAPNHDAAALMYAPVTGPSGTIYVGTNDGYTYALNPADGTPIWTYNKGNTAAPAIGPNEEIFKTVGGGQYETAAVERLDANGNQQWQFVLPGYGNFSSLTYISNTVYFGWPYNRSIYAINATDGTARWSYRVGDVSRQFSAPAVAPDGTVYVSSTDDYLYAFNGTDGSLLWSYQTGGDIWIRSSPAIGSDGTIYVGSADNYLYAVNSDGTLRWRYQTGNRIMSAPAIGADGTIYVGSEDHYVYALNSSDGSLHWRYQTGDSIGSSPAIGADGTVYIGSHDGYLYALAGGDGALKWRYPVGFYGGSASPAIGSDGTIYIGGDAGSGNYCMYALGEASATPTETPTATNTSTVTPVHTPTATPLPNPSVTPVAYWRMEEGSGSVVADSSGYGHD